MERVIEIANTAYFTFKSKNDMDDAHINFTGRSYDDWRSVSCGHCSQVSRLVLHAVGTGDTAYAQQGCGITFLANTYQLGSISRMSKSS